MGLVDYVVLHDIYNETRLLEIKNNWGFKFKVDDGNFETAIEFIEPFSKPGTIEVYHPPIAIDWNDADIIQCPDILDFENKIIIEYQEETGKRRRGAFLAKKGHGHPGDLANIRDSRRDSNYSCGGFRVLNIWESEYNDGSWKKKLWIFLCDCFCNRLTPKFPLQT